MTHPERENVNQRISIELLGHLTVTHKDDQITRFRTQKTASLLGYLACFLHRSHPREELIELLWPDVDIEAGRTSLRTALASLRRQLEPPNVPENSILIADRLTVQLNSELVTTDVAQFEGAIQRARRAEVAADRAAILTDAVALYHGPLMPGFYEDWVLRERTRLEQVFQIALQDLVAALTANREWDRAIEVATRLVAMEPLEEETHLTLMRLYAISGQEMAVKRQFREWERIAREELQEEPSPEARALLKKLLESTPGAMPPAHAVIISPPPNADAKPASHPASRLETPSARQVRLPLQLTRFFGREEEIEQGCTMLRDGNTRLLTLTGPGGTGKTRLALEIASRMETEFPNGIWFVPLADITEAGHLPESLARALALQRTTDRDPLEQSIERLSYGPALLLLDNFEQLPDEATDTIQSLLERVPTLSCLVTSRRLLLMGGEQEFPVAPLSIPQRTETAEHLLRFTSVQMFLDRARSVRPDFQITPANSASIAALCARLEGIPLAIELAASWAQVQTPAQMLDKLNRRFDLLTSRRKDLPPRHRTLRAAIEWSYRLLPLELQRLFARLSVFQGGFTIEAVEAICADPEPLSREASSAPLYAFMIMDLLAQLRERSLIIARQSGEVIRYGLLETLREFAQEQAPDSECETLKERHLTFFLAFAEQAEQRMQGAEQFEWMERLEQEHDNLRSALHTCQARGDTETGMRLGASLTPFWQARGYAREGLGWLERFLESRASISKATLARALSAFATLQELFGDWGRVLELYEQSLEIYDQLGDKSAMADVLQKMHSPVYFHDRNVVRAMMLLERSLVLYREVGNLEGSAVTLVSQGNLTRDQGDHKLAETLYAQSLSLYRQSGNKQGIAFVLADIGYMLTQQGQYPLATQALEEAISLNREINNKIGIAHSLWLLGRVKEMQRDFLPATALLEEAIAVAGETGNRQQLYNATTNLGILADLQQDYPTALTRHTEALNIAREMGNRWGIASSLMDMGRMTFFLGNYPRAHNLTLQSLQILRTGGSNYRIMNCLYCLAQIAAATGETRQAIQLFGAAENIRATNNWAILPADEIRYSTAIASLRTTLNEAEFTRLWEKGRQSSLEEILNQISGGSTAHSNTTII